MKRIVALGAVAVLMAGCAALPSVLPFGPDDVQVATQPMPGQLEPIHAAALVNNVAVFWVSSNGCTTKDDLTPVVETHGDASVITLRRISEDRCKTPLDDGFEVQWSYQELGLRPGATVSVNNPYQLPQT
jgi:hypothetical protein